jgi:hypothetical protein
MIGFTTNNTGPTTYSKEINYFWLEQFQIRNRRIGWLEGHADWAGRRMQIAGF